MLPLLLALQAGTAAAGAVGAGIASATDPYAKLNRKRIDELQANPNMGLDPGQRALLETAATRPVEQAAGRALTEQQRFAAQAGNGNGAAQSALRKAADTAIAGAHEQAGMQIGMADVAAVQSNKAELEARVAAQAQHRRDTVNAILAPLTGGLAGVGQTLGETPEFTRAAGLAGSPVKDFAAFAARLQASGYSPEVAGAISEAFKRNGGDMMKALSDPAMLAFFKNMSVRQPSDIQFAPQAGFQAPGAPPPGSSLRPGAGY